LFLIVFAHSALRAQQQTYPEVYTPSAGDTLDAVERDYYRLFETIEGFEWGTFSLNEGGSLQTDICYLQDSVRKHIVIERFSSMSTLEDKVEDVYRMSSREKSTSMVEKSATESWHVFLSAGDRVRACTLDSLQDTFLMIRCSGRAMVLPVDSIFALVSPKISRFWIGAAIGSVAGAVVGALIGSAVVENQARGIGPDPSSIPAIAGGAIGAIAGCWGGGSIASAFSGRKVYDLHGKTIPQKVQVIQAVLEENH
jgi:hypothetical protein